MKKCTICNKLKALEDFGKSKSAKDGRRNQCKECINAQKRAKFTLTKLKNLKQRESDKEIKKDELLKASSKICFTCGLDKPKEQFTKDMSKIDNLHPSCKECKNSKVKQNRLNNIDEKRAKDKAYRLKNKEAKAKSDAKYRNNNKEQLSIKKKKYYEENKDKLKEYNRNRLIQRSSEQIELDRIRKHENYVSETNEQKQRRKEYGKKYHKTPSGKLSSMRNANKRRALKLSQDDGTVTSQALEELKELQEHKCHYCKTLLEYDKTKAVHLDHYIPLSAGGMHSMSNVVWSCGPCNWSKRSIIPTQPLSLQDREHLLTYNASL